MSDKKKIFTPILTDEYDVVLIPKEWKTLTFAEAEAWLQKHKNFREDNRSFYEVLKEALTK